MSISDKLIYSEQARLTEENFNWSFLEVPSSTWAMAHVLNPFLIQTIFQDWKLSVIIFFAWESIEVLFLILFKKYQIFFGDESEYEPVGDSLIGDIINGILGVILSFMFQIVFKVPRLTPSIYSRLSNITIKRILLYLGMILPFLTYNSTISHKNLSYPIYIGVFISMLVHTILLSYSWLYFNNTKEEINQIWGGKKSKKHRSQIYIALISLLVCFQYLGTYYITYVYYQVWSIWGISMIILILLLASQGRLYELFYFFTLEYRKNPKKNKITNKQQ